MVTTAKYCAGKLWLLAHSLVLPVMALSGEEKHSKNHLTVHVIGADRAFIAFVSRLLFSDTPRIKPLRPVSPWALETYHATPETNLIFVRMDRFFMTFLQSNGYVTMPEWITMILPLRDHHGDLRTSVRRNMRRIIQRRITDDYTYETTTDPERLDEFYHDMYVPYVQRRFGDCAIITPYKRMKELFKTGMLLFVKKNNTCTQGILIKHRTPTMAMLTHCGALETDTDTSAQGMGPILYYFSILWAKEHNVSHLDLGICRGFLDDGVMQNKRRWNAAIRPWRSRNIPDQFSEIIGMRFGDATESLQQSLCHNPFIYLDGKSRLHGMICVPSEKIPAAKEMRHYQNTYAFPGLTSLTITTPQRLKRQEDPLTMQPIEEQRGAIV